ncbi:MAG: hypothetical protein AAF378_21455 [Cyanobacteria bacterium P01_A01_bin.84]
MYLQNNQNSLERRRLMQLAREYRQKGYKVIINPTPEKLPSSLAECSLDMIAVSGSKVVAAEVRTKENLTLNGSEDLRYISKSVSQLPGWEFELVITNSRKKNY